MIDDAARLEALLRVALPPLRLALRERYLVVRRHDPAAAVVAAEELATVERILEDQTGIDVVLSDPAMQPLGGAAARDELACRQLPLARHFVFMCGNYREAARLRVAGALVVEKPFENARQLAEVVAQAAAPG